MISDLNQLEIVDDLKKNHRVNPNFTLEGFVTGTGLEPLPPGKAPGMEMGMLLVFYEYMILILI